VGLNDHSSRPEDVNDQNWDELHEQGFTWLSNASRLAIASGEQGGSDYAYVTRLISRYGGENVKLGHPMHQGRPSATFQGESLVGIYVKQSS